MANIKVAAVAGKIAGPAGSMKDIQGVPAEVDTPENLLKGLDRSVPVIIFCAEVYPDPPVKSEEVDCHGECGRRLLLSITSKHLAEEAAKKGQEALYLCAWCCKEVLENIK